MTQETSIEAAIAAARSAVGAVVGTSQEVRVALQIVRAMVDEHGVDLAMAAELVAATFEGEHGAKKQLLGGSGD